MLMSKKRVNKKNKQILRVGIRNDCCLNQRKSTQALLCAQSWYIEAQVHLSQYFSRYGRRNFKPHASAELISEAYKVMLVLSDNLVTIVVTEPCLVGRFLDLHIDI